MALEKRIAAVRAFIETMPAATISPKAALQNPIYRLMGKTFAILWTGKTVGLILKSDRAQMLREQYEGIGHRSHLDARHWIAVDLDADVSLPEIRKLIQASYDLIAAGLTKKQQAELTALKEQ